MKNKTLNRTTTIMSSFVLTALCACAPVSPAHLSSQSTPAPSSFLDGANENPVLSAPSAPPPAAAPLPATSAAAAPHEDPEIVVVAHRPVSPANLAPAAPAHASPTHAAPTHASLASLLPIPAWAAKPQSASWTKMTIKAIEELGAVLIQTEIQDAQDFCPAYKSLLALEREKVWVQLISSMAKFESDFDPISAFTENFKGSDNKLVVSRGLLQISKGSANSYGCGIANEVDLENAETNLRCGVRIISTLVTKYHSIHGRQLNDASNVSNRWMGAARYWSVLRQKAKDSLIRASVRQLSICQA